MCRSSDSTVSEDAGIEPSTLAAGRWEPSALPYGTLLDFLKYNLPIIIVCVLPGRASICPVVVLRSWEPLIC
jgi:hypothetical protein